MPRKSKPKMYLVIRTCHYHRRLWKKGEYVEGKLLGPDPPGHFELIVEPKELKAPKKPKKPKVPVELKAPVEPEEPETFEDEE